MYPIYPVEHPFHIPLLHALFVRDYSFGFHFPGELHNFWECVLVLKGEVCVSGDKHVYELPTNDIIFHKPMEIHKFHVDHEDGTRLLIFSFRITGEACAYFEDRVSSLSEEQMAVVHALLTYLAARKSDKEERLALNMPSTARGNTSSVTMIVTCITQLLLLLLQGSERKPPTHTTEAAAFSEAAGYLETHIGECIGSEALAHHLGISLSGLKRLFRRYVDMGVHAYFMHLKLRYAIVLFQEGFRVTEIAARLGFSSQAHFSRAFTRAMDYAPSAAGEASAVALLFCSGESRAVKRARKNVLNLT